MSKKYPECPLYNHNGCRDMFNEKVCAIVKEDKICLKKRPKVKKSSESPNGSQEDDGLNDSDEG
jgi:hypothetical protein